MLSSFNFSPVFLPSKFYDYIILVDSTTRKLSQLIIIFKSLANGKGVISLTPKISNNCFILSHIKCMIGAMLLHNCETSQES